MANEYDFAPSVLGLPDHLATYIVPATPADLYNSGNEIDDCRICYFEFSPSPADKETTAAATTTTATATATTEAATVEQAVPCRPPVRLKQCSHVFCRVCILVHLNGHHLGPTPLCPTCRRPCYPQTAAANDTLSDVDVDIDDLEEVGNFTVEGVSAGGGEEEEDRGDILAFLGEEKYEAAEAGERGEEIEKDEKMRIEEDEEMRDYEWEDEDDEDDEEDGDFELEEEEEVEEEYEEDDGKFDLMELSE